MTKKGGDSIVDPILGHPVNFEASRFCDRSR
jgi:hypothetical protein